MKQILLMFGSVAAVLLGLALLYVNLIDGYYDEIGYLIGDVFGVLFLAAGITGIWAIRRMGQH